MSILTFRCSHTGIMITSEITIQTCKIFKIVLKIYYIILYIINKFISLNYQLVSPPDNFHDDCRKPTRSTKKKYFLLFTYNEKEKRFLFCIQDDTYKIITSNWILRYASSHKIQGGFNVRIVMLISRDHSLLRRKYDSNISERFYCFVGPRGTDAFTSKWRSHGISIGKFTRLAATIFDV